MSYLFKLWPWVDHDIFYFKVKFCNLGFSTGKNENSGFSETILACNLKVARCRKLIWLIKVSEYSRSMSFLDLGLRSFTYENQNLLLSETTGHFNQILFVSS